MDQNKLDNTLLHTSHYADLKRNTILVYMIWMVNHLTVSGLHGNSLVSFQVYPKLFVCIVICSSFKLLFFVNFFFLYILIERWQTTICVSSTKFNNFCSLLILLHTTYIIAHVMSCCYWLPYPCTPHNPLHKVSTWEFNCYCWLKLSEPPSQTR